MTMVQENFELDLKNVSERAINEWLVNTFAYSANCSDEMRATLEFIIEYYNKTLSSLNSMEFGDEYSPTSINFNESLQANEHVYGVKKLIIDIDKDPNLDKSLDNTFYIQFMEILRKFGDEKGVKNFFDEFVIFLKNNKENKDFESMPVQFLSDRFDVIFNESNLKENEKKELISTVLEFLIKYNRFCNLRAKFAHTSRMVYITLKQLENMEVNVKVKELILSSVLYHDIGRFYQAIHYPNFKDDVVKKNEGEKLSSHAEVGYYFPLQNLLIKDLLRTSNNMSGEFLIHSLMSVPIKYHQKSNSELKHYDSDYSVNSITDEDVSKLQRFIKKVYDLAPNINLESKYRLKLHFDDIDTFNEDIARLIVECINAVSNYENHVANNSNLTDSTDELGKSINNLRNYLKKYYINSDYLEQLVNDISLLNEPTFLEKIFLDIGEDCAREVVKIIDGYDLGENISSRLAPLKEKISRKDFSSYLNDFFELQYLFVSKNCNDKDYSEHIKSNLFIRSILDSEKISQEIKNVIFMLLNGEDISNFNLESIFRDVTFNIFGEDYTDTVALCHKLLCAATTITTDMDKIDILVQRANGSWELTNGSRLSEKKLFNGSDEVDVDAIIDFDCRKNFYVNSNLNRDNNQIRVLWWQIEQFITKNMRNYSSFLALRDLDLMSTIYKRILDVQIEDYKDILAPLIKEPLAFCEMFIEVALNTRLDQTGELILPKFEYSENYDTWKMVPCNDEMVRKPSLFNSEQMKKIKAVAFEYFKFFWQFNKEVNKPKDGVEIIFRSEVGNFNNNFEHGMQSSHKLI